MNYKSITCLCSLKILTLSSRVRSGSKGRNLWSNMINTFSKSSRVSWIEPPEQTCSTLITIIEMNLWVPEEFCIPLAKSAFQNLSPINIFKRYTQTIKRVSEIFLGISNNYYRINTMCLKTWIFVERSFIMGTSYALALPRQKNNFSSIRKVSQERRNNDQTHIAILRRIIKMTEKIEKKKLKKKI